MKVRVFTYMSLYVFLSQNEKKKIVTEIILHICGYEFSKIYLSNYLSIDLSEYA